MVALQEEIITAKDEMARAEAEVAERGRGLEELRRQVLQEVVVTETLRVEKLELQEALSCLLRDTQAQSQSQSQSWSRHPGLADRQRALRSVSFSPHVEKTSPTATRSVASFPEAEGARGAVRNQRPGGSHASETARTMSADTHTVSPDSTTCNQS